MIEEKIELPSPDFIEEMRLYAENCFYVLAGKAKIVHEKCIAAGKKSLAKKIAKKHGKPIGPYVASDLAVSMAYALVAKNRKDNGIQ